MSCARCFALVPTVDPVVEQEERGRCQLDVSVQPRSRIFTTKQRDTISLRRFLRAVEEGGKGAGFFQQGQHLVRLAERWSQVIPRERVHVVVCPAPGSSPRLLVERFCEVIGVDPGPLTFPEGMANPSLGLAQVEVLRRVNVALGDRLPGPRRGYREVGKLWLSSQVLLRQGGQRPLLPHRIRPWVEQTTQEWIDFLGHAGVDVVGDPEDLRPPESAFGVERIDEAAVTQAAVDALADILEMRHEELRTAARGRRRRGGSAPVPDEGPRSVGAVLQGAARRARELSRRVSDR